MIIDEVFEKVKKFDDSADLRLPDNDLSDIQFEPASIKGLIPNGIFFIVGDKNVNIDFDHSIILSDHFFETKSSAVIKVENPQLIHYKLCTFFDIPSEITIHPTAVISSEAKIGKNVHIGAFSIIGDCEIGDNVRIMHHVVVENKVTIKENVFIDSNSVIGASGMAWIWDNDRDRVLQPQLGGVIIEPFVKIGTDVTVVRGSLSENTLIGSYTVIAHGSKIGHGSKISEKVHLANNVSLAGNSIVEAFAFLGSGCIVSSNIRISKGTIVGAGAVVTKIYDDPNLILAGVPAKVKKSNNYNEKPNGAPKPFKI